MTRRVVLVTALFALAAVGRWRVQAIEPSAAVELTQVPVALDEWKGRMAPPLDAATLEILRPDDYLNRVYESGTAGEVALFVAYYRSQAQGAALHSPLNCLPGAGWEPVTTDRIPMGDRGFARRVLIQKGEDRNLVLYWYQSAARLEGNEYFSKLFLAFDAIKLRRNDAALVRFVAPIDNRRPDGLQVAEQSVMRLARLAEPAISGLLFR
jgi:EpsI family protein